MKCTSLVSGTGVTFSILGLIIDCFALFVLESVIYQPYNPGGGLMLFSGIVITILVVAARKLPADFLKTKQSEPDWRTRKFAIVGTLLFPATLLTGGFAAAANSTPIIHIIFSIALAI